MNMILDNSEFRAQTMKELSEFFEEREATAQWFSDDCKADTVRFSPIFDEPLCVPAEVSQLRANKAVKFLASEEAYADSMYSPGNGYEGSSQMMLVAGGLHPVGNSAIKGVLERAGIKMDGWDKLRDMNPVDLSEVLNKFFKATKGNLTILVQDEKVRAVNSGRYAVCPYSTVLNAVQEWITFEYPDAEFAGGYVNHDYATWKIDLGVYVDDVLGNFPVLKSQGFLPAMIVRLSHTGTSSVSFIPCLRIGEIFFPLCEGIDAPHIAKGNFDERMASMESSVKNNLFSVFPKMGEVAKKLDTMRSMQVANAYNALLRGMKALQMPKAQGMEAAEVFKSLYGYTATAYDIYVTLGDVCAYVQRDFPNDHKKNLAVAKSMERAIAIDWVKLGNIPGEFSR